jgi:hypothetical protein
MNVVAVHGDFTGFASADFMPIIVNHRNPVTGIRASHAAGLCGPLLMAIADDVIHLGLSEHFIRRHFQCFFTPVKHGVANRFPALIIARNFSLYLSRGAGTAFIIIFRAVGNKKVLVTLYLSSR